MNEDAIRSKLLVLFRDIFEDDELELSDETTAADVDGWDSLTNVQLMVAVEREFNGVRFSTSEVASLRNVGDLIEKIKIHQGSG